MADLRPAGNDLPSVTYTLTDDDHVAFAWTTLVRTMGLGWLGVTLVAWLLLSLVHPVFGLVFASFVAAAGVALFPVFWWSQRSQTLAELRRRPKATELTLRLRPEGIELQDGAHCTLHSWRGYGKPRSTRYQIEIPMGNQHCIVPARAFTDRRACDSFFDQIVMLRGAPPLPPPDLDEAGEYVHDVRYSLGYDDIVAIHALSLDLMEPPQRSRRFVWAFAALAATAVALGVFVAPCLSDTVLLFGAIAIWHTAQGRSLRVRFGVWRQWIRGDVDLTPRRFRARRDRVTWRDGTGAYLGPWQPTYPVVATDRFVLVSNANRMAILPTAALGPNVESFVQSLGDLAIATPPGEPVAEPLRTATDPANPFAPPERDP